MNDILKYKTYFAEIHFSAEDEVFYGKLIGINDLVNFEADSVKGLKNAFIEATEDYLNTCKQINKNPDKVYKGSFNVRVSADLHRKAAIAATLKNITLNDFIKYAIDTTITKESLQLNH